MTNTCRYHLSTLSCSSEGGGWTEGGLPGCGALIQQASHTMPMSKRPSWVPGWAQVWECSLSCCRMLPLVITRGSASYDLLACTLTPQQCNPFPVNLTTVAVTLFMAPPIPPWPRCTIMLQAADGTYHVVSWPAGQHPVPAAPQQWSHPVLSVFYNSAISDWRCAMLHVHGHEMLRMFL